MEEECRDEVYNEVEDKEENTLDDEEMEGIENIEQFIKVELSEEDIMMNENIPGQSNNEDEGGDDEKEAEKLLTNCKGRYNSMIDRYCALLQKSQPTPGPSLALPPPLPEFSVFPKGSKKKIKLSDLKILQESLDVKKTVMGLDFRSGITLKPGMWHTNKESMRAHMKLNKVKRSIQKLEEDCQKVPIESAQVKDEISAEINSNNPESDSSEEFYYGYGCRGAGGGNGWVSSKNTPGGESEGETGGKTVKELLLDWTSDKALSKKVITERKRRKGLAQLFDNLQDMINAEVDQSGQLVVPMRTKKSTYGERTLAAIACIEELQGKIEEQEELYRTELVRNALLRKRLQTLSADDDQKPWEDSSYQMTNHFTLYNCPACPNVLLANVAEAFVHLDECPSHQSTVNTGLYNTKVTRTLQKASQNVAAAARGRPKKNLVTVVKCQECPTVCLDMDVLRVHKFLHQDLTYLKCPSCLMTFGSPNQLKRHVFLEHHNILETADLHTCVLSIQERVNMTTQVQEAMTIGDPEKIDLVENFLTATIDASLILQELELQAEVDRLPNAVLSDLLVKFLGRQPESMMDKDQDLGQKSGQGVRMDVPFVEVQQQMCIKLEPPTVSSVDS